MATTAHDQFMSPYLCPWRRNGRSLDDARATCPAGGKRDCFWPAGDRTLADVRPVPTCEMATGRTCHAEHRVLVRLYCIYWFEQST